MAKILRKTAKIFGASAGLNQIAQFGSLAAGAIAYSTDPAVVQNLANWLTGWFGAVVGGNSPAIEDMNAVLYVLAYQIAYAMQEGVCEWDSGTTYFIGSMVNSAGSLYVSLTDNNTNNAVTDITNWKRFRRGLTQKTANYALVAATDDVVEFNCTTGLMTATLPAAATSLQGKEFTIVKTDASTNPCQISGAVSAYQLNAQYDSVTLFCNGTVWYSV